MANIEYMQDLAEKFTNDEIPFLKDNDKFEFACEQCGQCCRNRDDILLNPLDVYHLSVAKQMSCKEILAKYGDRYIGSHSNLPVVRLKYRQEDNGQTTCYFLGRKDGKFYCRVQDYKPTVCRTYPLGKVQRFGKDESIKYFLQDLSDEKCAVMERAHNEHIQQTVVDWVGGYVKKSVSDRYSEIFNAFAQKYHKALNFKRFKKRATPEAFNLFFTMLENAMYGDFDKCLNDEDFLQKLRMNLEIVLEFAKLVDKNPMYLLELEKKARNIA